MRYDIAPDLQAMAKALRQKEQAKTDEERMKEYLRMHEEVAVPQKPNYYPPRQPIEPTI
jgi:hypothetical protein